jgi:hypothetical protein
MSEGFITLFDNTPAEGNRPHYKGFFKIEGVEHEFALWPSRDGKKGYSGKYKPKEAKQTPHNEAKANAYQPEQPVLGMDEIPF